MRALPALFLLACLTSVSIAETRELSVSAGDLVMLEMARPSAVVVNQPIKLKYQSLALADGRYVVIFCACGNEKEIILTSFANGELIPEVTQWVITVDGEGPDPPRPPPEPDDTLTGIAKTIRDRGRAAKVPRETAQAIATNCEVVATKLAAVSSLTIADAKAELIKLNQEACRKHGMPRAAEPLQTAIVRYLNDYATSRTKLQEALDGIGQGFKAI